MTQESLNLIVTAARLLEHCRPLLDNSQEWAVPKDVVDALYAAVADVLAASSSRTRSER